MNLTNYPYSSSRRVVMGSQGAVATGQPLAAAAGIEMLHAGGNAVDAAVAMAIALTVLEPTANGLGSDAFALVWDGQLHGLNASGKSPAGISLKDFDGLDRVPERGWPSVTVPGAVSAWQALWRRWGSLPFDRLCETGIRYATEGYPVSPQVSRLWQREAEVYRSLQGPEYEFCQQLFFEPIPQAGDRWSSSGHAATLSAIATSEGDSFYRGEIADKIAAFSTATGGYLTREDLANHQPEWVAPISTSYRDFTVWELPPNGQGIAALMALNILEGSDIARYPRDSADSYHLQIEAMKLAFADAHRHVADPDAMTVTLAQMLDKDYASDRRRSIGHRAIPLAEPGLPRGGTVYLAAADGDLMVSFIQSNFMNFGSGIAIPGTGISLQNRGAGFSLDPQHPNCLAPNKRPFHTIIPAFLTRNGEPLGPFGVMGGPMQPQGHLQVVANVVDYDMNPQVALDAPRWRFDRGNRVFLEQSVPNAIALELGDRGHDIVLEADPSGFGKGQAIFRAANGTFVAASDPRADGLAIAL